MPTESLRPPQITLVMTNQQFCKFQIGGVSQIDAQLYSLCEDSVQNSIVNTNGDYFFLSEKNMTQIIETIVTKYSSPAVHCLNFANLSEGESMQNLFDCLIKLYCSGLWIFTFLSSSLTIHLCKGSVYTRITQ